MLCLIVKNIKERTKIIIIFLCLICYEIYELKLIIKLCILNYLIKKKREMSFKWFLKYFSIWYWEIWFVIIYF